MGYDFRKDFQHIDGGPRKYIHDLPKSLGQFDSIFGVQLGTDFDISLDFDRRGLLRGAPPLVQPS